MNKLLTEYVEIAGKLLDGELIHFLFFIFYFFAFLCLFNINSHGRTFPDSFAEITEEALLKYLAQSHKLNSKEIDDIHLPNLPRPPNAFRGIRKKNSSLKRWLAICSDDLTK